MDAHLPAESGEPTRSYHGSYLSWTVLVGRVPWMTMRSEPARHQSHGNESVRAWDVDGEDGQEQWMACAQLQRSLQVVALMHGHGANGDRGHEHSLSRHGEAH